MVFFNSSQQKNDNTTEQNIKPKGNVDKKEESKQDNSGPGKVVEDKQKINQSMILNEITNSGTRLDLDKLENYVMNNFSNIKDKFSSGFFKALSGYSKEEIERNLRYNDFKAKLQKNISEAIKKIKKQKNTFDLQIIQYLNDLDIINIKDTFGYREGKKKSITGEEIDTEKYSHQPYRLIDIKKTIKHTIRQNNKEIKKENLIAKTLGSKKESYIYLLLDISSSMSGKKTYIAKRAAIALAYKTIKDKNKIGLIAFNNKIITHIKLTNNFHELLKAIVELSPTSRTNIAKALEKAVHELTSKKGKKHIILISDILETFDEDKVYKAASLARAENITISIIGTEINKAGKNLSSKIIETTQGKYYQFKLNNLDTIILEDYSNFSS